jgi:DNA mismatch repair protein MutL
MSCVKILPEILANKIAAGEVVERPASVVKELVENAIDARGTWITVDIEKGGRRLIRVSDNGTGMAHEDALLATERYATSKVYDEEDLFSISTLGFRGEALPSIASVSKMEIVTKTEVGDEGTRIVIHGGRTDGVSTVGAAQGTVVTVSDLFYNTPARKKHLKTQPTEMGHVTDAFSRIAMARPDIHFALTHNGKSLADYGATSNWAFRITDVLKGHLEQDLFELDTTVDAIRIYGLLASPQITRTNSRHQFLFVNGRPVRDRVLYHAVMQGYEPYMTKGKFPVVALFVTLPRNQVDVNVHPTKRSVRFDAPKLIHDAMARAIRSRIKDVSRPAWIEARPAEIRGSLRQYRLSSDDSKIGQSSAPFPAWAAPPAEDTQRGFWTKPGFADLVVIGQLHHTYILCESPEGLVLIDQHAAHERVLFESLRTDYRRSQTPCQPLLVPEKVELGYREAHILESIKDELYGMGLAVEHFGGTTYRVRSVPQILVGQAAGPLVMDIVEKVAQMNLTSGLEQAVNECISVMACHGAIRAGKKMSPDEMTALLEQLDQLDDPTHCPHGRPTIIRKRLYDIEKAFKRVP